VSLAMTALKLTLAAYLFGSVPYGVLVGALHGVDVMNAGSRNTGATNVGRLLGRRWGVLVFLLDMTKGFLPTLLAVFVLDGLRVAGQVGPVTARLVGLGVGLACILGHNYSLVLRFRGGRGVATSLGVCLGVYPDLTVPALAAFLVWMAVVVISRYISLGSVTACAVFPVFVVGWSVMRGSPALRHDWPLLTFALLVAVLGLYRHRANIGRLLVGTEHRIGQSRPLSGMASQPPPA